MATFTMVPQDVAKVETKNRSIVTAIPAPGAVEIISEMRKVEPRLMSGQPPVVWDKAVGYTIYDKWGNRWIDFSSGVVVANAGHCNPEVQKATLEIIGHGLMHSYCFPNEPRAKLVKLVHDIVPIPDNRVFLLSTGAESTECAIKLARTYGGQKSDKKIKIITFNDCFHGRTLGSQMAGGSPSAKTWIKNLDPGFVQVPFPNAFYYEWADEKRDDYSDDVCFGKFLESLKDAGADPSEIAGIMTETFQGGWVQLMPKGFVQRLRAFCDENDILLIFDEVQAGFGRTGKLFGFEHAEVTPDIICCGKGISSGMPLSAVIGKAHIMDLYGPNKMTSTHSGNPVSSTAAYHSIKYILNHGLVENSCRLGEVAGARLREIQAKHPDRVGFVSGTGLAWALILTVPGTKDMDGDLATRIVELCMQRGVMMFAPVGNGSTIKVVPPLMINEEALREGLDVLESAVDDAIAELA